MNRYIFFIIVALIFSLSNFFVKGRNPDYKKTHIWVTILVLLGLIIEVIGEMTSRLLYNNSLFYNLLFVYSETCLFFYFFYMISEDEIVKKRIVFVSVFFLIFGVFSSLYFQNIHLEFHNYSYAIGSLAIVALSINFFLGIFNFKKYEEKNLLSIPYFWIVTVILFFYSATFFYFTPIKLLYVMESSLIEPLNIIIRFLAGLMYLILGLAFYAPMIFKEKY